MDVTVRRIDDGYRFEGKGDRVGTIVMDNGAGSGGKGEAPSPLQAFLMTVGGCSGIDVVSILEKSRQRIDDLKIEIHADREKHGFISPFEHVHLHFIMTGDMDDNKAARAVRLSLEKYCTVSYMLKKAVSMTASISVNGGDKTDVPLEL
ncbi:MAG: OsmC family protein [Rhodothermales bacterium]|nr:OsmC family protein [Rhodothermales bacterium]